MNRIVAATIVALMMAAGPGLALAQQAPPATPTPAPAPKTTAQPQSLVNLNSATKDDLEKLPGIGPSMAQRIIDYRQKNGSFKKIEDLMNIPGIGEKSFLKLRPLITVAPPKAADR
jgi:competence protein ComEA